MCIRDSPGRVATRKKLAERTGVAREAKKKKQKTSEAPSEQKESGSGGANEYLLLGIEGLSISALGVYYQRKAKPGSQRNWST